MAQDRQPEPEALLLCETHKRRIQAQYGLRDIILPIETILDASVREEILEDLEDGLRDFGSLMSMPPEQIGLGRRLAIRISPEQPRDDPPPMLGPALHLEFGDHTIICLVDDEDARLCERFAHQWAQALFRELRHETTGFGRDLCAALANALLHGPPGGPHTLTQHCQRILAAAEAVDAIKPVPEDIAPTLVGSSFEAFLESETVRMDGDTAERLWRCCPQNGTGILNLPHLYGWPKDIERERAIGYWHMVRGVLSWNRAGIAVREGSAAIARSELERHRRRRHYLDTEKLFAALTLQSLDEDRTDNCWPVLMARDGHASAQIVADGLRDQFREQAVRQFAPDDTVPALTSRMAMEIKHAVASSALEVAWTAGVYGATVSLSRWRGDNAIDMSTTWRHRARRPPHGIPMAPGALQSVLVHASDESPCGCVLRIGSLKEIFELMSEDIVRRLGVAAILGSGADGSAVIVWHRDTEFRHWTVELTFPDATPHDGTGLRPVRATDYRALLGFRPPDPLPLPAQAV